MEDYDAAKEIGQDALEAREATLGPKHPYTLTSVSTIDLVLERQGKYEEAEGTQARAIRT